jgi:hypothetical protein
MTTTEFVEEAFVNEFGQKIEPGEEVLYAGTSRKSTNIRKAFFKGVRYADVTRYHYIKDENGDYIKEDYFERWSGITFRRNKTEKKTTREVVSVVVSGNRGKQYKLQTGPDGKKAYVKTDEDVYGISILPLKRAYKFSTNLSELAG